MADNLGQYALAKFVQSKTGSYPHLPLADFEPNQDPKNRKAMFTLVDGQLAVNDRNAYSKAVSGPLVSSIDDISSSCDDADAGGDDCATSPQSYSPAFPNPVSSVPPQKVLTSPSLKATSKTSPRPLTPSPRTPP